MKIKRWVATFIVTAMFYAPGLYAQDSSNNGGIDNTNNIIGGRHHHSGNNNTNSGPSSVDQRFVTQAGQADLLEIQMGQLAAQNGSNADVVAFGQQLVDDHTVVDGQLAPLAASDGFDVPTSLDKAHQRQLDRMSKLSGVQFDRAFVRFAISTHQQSIRLFQKEADHGGNSDLQSFAKTNLPVLQQHLAEARQLAKELKGNGNGNGHGHNKHHHSQP